MVPRRRTDRDQWRSVAGWSSAFRSRSAVCLLQPAGSAAPTCDRTSVGTVPRARMMVIGRQEPPLRTCGCTMNNLLRGFCRCPESNIVAELFVLGLIFMKEFLEERLRLVRSLAENADPFTKRRLLELADSYEAGSEWPRRRRGSWDKLIFLRRQRKRWRSVFRLASRRSRCGSPRSSSSPTALSPAWMAAFS